MNAVEEIGKRAKLVTSDVANLAVDIRNQILLDMSSALVANWQEIVAANKKIWTRLRSSRGQCVID